MPEVLVTTSWDDGHALDTKLAHLLQDCGCRGTFYVAPLSHEISAGNRLSHSALRDLSTTFEVGSHTLTHPRLTEIAPSQADREITDGKRAVEDIVGGPVTSFCYPYGAYNQQHVDMVRRAGFLVGRTTRRFSVERSLDPLQMATTTASGSLQGGWLEGLAVDDVAAENRPNLAQLGHPGPTALRGSLRAWWGHSHMGAQLGD